MLSGLAAFVLDTRAGLVQRDTVAGNGILVPGALVGFDLATLTVGHIHERVFRYAAAAAIVIGGAVLLRRTIQRR